jgi:predicted HAD superfamily Cof-like phosphohydrolase
MTHRYFGDVGEFHRKFNIPAYDPRDPCEFPSPEIVAYRLKFLEEELQELRAAIEAKNLPEVMDALADLAYVVFGTAHYFNAPFPMIWDAVHNSNMERVACTPENCPPDKQYRADMVIKPPGWKGPQIEKILESHNSFARRMIRRKR